MALVLLDCYRNIAECCIPTPHTRTKFFIVCTVFVRVFLTSVCVSVISVSLLESNMLPGLESLREDLEASQPDKVVSTHPQYPFLCT